jgi:hypothetical protein
MGELSAQKDQLVACMPHLLDADMHPSQQETTAEGSKGNEAEEAAEACQTLHGLEEQVSQRWGSLPEDGNNAQHMGAELLDVQDQAEEHESDHGPEPEDRLFFGPHSPRTQLGHEFDAPTVEDASESEPEDGPALGLGGANPLKEFLVSASRPVDQGLLPPPPTASAQSDRDKAARKDPQITKRSSGRLAAKPSAGWSTMDKV